MPSPALRNDSYRTPASTVPAGMPSQKNLDATQNPNGLRIFAPDQHPAQTAPEPIAPPSRTKIWSCLIASLIAGVVFSTLTGCQWAAGSQNSQGAALYNQGQYTAAMEQFQKAIASDPTDADGYYNLAATTHRLGNQRQDPNLIRQSEALYNQCLDHDPNHIDCHRGLAVLLVDSGRPDRAFTLLKNWAAANPNLADPRIELARLYEEHGEPQTALKYLEDAVQQDANNARAWLALARLRESGNDPVQALQNYQRALALNGGVLGPNGAMISERVAALSRQINSTRDAASFNAGGTQMATPGGFNSARY
ncbi:tetratricopeptide repeat protein [Rhodopirellula sp. JC740]|uniref:Tetratricopeptide repeat protein n=1 Tax=Rhodopirellula halodulae TaxID=2894198 RepID=A0ABS8NFS5_9BACT|nr:tetratricopeptide repeat protein [Rhodopirellula sp. JC740]MCC9642407.1 tetratricopeptide repeat protein [Rhodopirellula sp. JC740]